MEMVKMGKNLLKVSKWLKSDKKGKIWLNKVVEQRKKTLFTLSKEVAWVEKLGNGLKIAWITLTLALRHTSGPCPTVWEPLTYMKFCTFGAELKRRWSFIWKFPLIAEFKQSVHEHATSCFMANALNKWPKVNLCIWVLLTLDYMEFREFKNYKLGAFVVKYCWTHMKLCTLRTRTV